MSFLKLTTTLKVICLVSILVVNTSDAKPQTQSGPFQSRKDFVTRLYPCAKHAAAKIGVDPKVLVAQAAHETDWGKRMPKTAEGHSSHNLFGIKSYSKKSQAVSSTSEYVNNKKIKTTASFKVYQGYDQSFMDYANLICSSKRYQKALSHSHDPFQYLESIQLAGYASDPNYAKKIYEKYQTPLIQNIKK